MESTKSHYLVPKNIKGKHTDVEHSVTLNSNQEAITLFSKACKRMLDINKWHKIIGFASAQFSIKDNRGVQSNSLAKVGDYIEIDVPGPGPSSGDGFDWVEVESIDDHSDSNAEKESMGMRVRSAKNPKKASTETAHFFTNNATSVFIIHRQNNIVTSSYHGRNELLNTDTEKVQDKIRNTLVGGAALIGISELQWSLLVKSFLEKED